MLPSEAAKRLNMSTQTLRLGLQQDKFPFGTAIMTTKAEDSKTGKPRWTYYINSARLDRYLKGEDYETSITNNITLDVV